MNSLKKVLSFIFGPALCSIALAGYGFDVVLMSFLGISGLMAFMLLLVIGVQALEDKIQKVS